MIRDPASIAIGVVLPVILILLFGFGLSLDVKNVPIALYLEESTPQALDVAAGFQLVAIFRTADRALDGCRPAATGGARGGRHRAGAG